MAHTGFKHEIAGQKFGRLTAVRRLQVNGRTKWECVCECGAILFTGANNLVEGRSTSCGCLRREKSIAAHTTHGLTHSAEYRAWAGMKSRCYNTSRSDYERYGGRGITVDQRWLDDFVAFLSDIGPKPSMEHSIDRIDNEGPYAPWNCKWSTRSEQMRNRRVRVDREHILEVFRFHNERRTREAKERVK